MTEEKKKKESGEISRREFLKDAGLIVGGAAIGSTVLLAACGDGEVTTETVTETTTKTETDTVTTTEQVGEVTTTTTATETVEVSKFICPYDGQEFDTLAALQAHVAAAHPTAPAIEGLTTLTVNGQTYLTQVKPNWTLAFVLREKLGLVATKIGCDRGTCGTCTVLVDGRAVYSCMLLAMEAEGTEITTVEGLSDGITLHAIQQAFIDNDAVQCGYCIPGYMMSAKALLDANPKPTRDEVREALSGHLCICGNTKKIVAAVLSV
jgi:aerobic-type carbon monoxide dehydrogenase small subunit (CoxS/CutS family)